MWQILATTRLPEAEAELDQLNDTLSHTVWAVELQNKLPAGTVCGVHSYATHPATCWRRVPKNGEVADPPAADAFHFLCYWLQPIVSRQTSLRS